MSRSPGPAGPVLTCRQCGDGAGVTVIRRRHRIRRTRRVRYWCRRCGALVTCRAPG